VLAWLVIGIIVQAVVFTGTRASVLSKAGAAMGESANGAPESTRSM